MSWNLKWEIEIHKIVGECNQLTKKLFVICDVSANACSKGKFKCNNGACIDEKLRCNNIVNCNDGSDEFDCARNLTST